MANKRVDLNEVFGGDRYTSYQLMVSFLCFCLVLLDGFDLTVIGVALPKIADFLHVKPGALGLALAAGQVGPLIGTIILGPLGDRWGRKWVLFGCALVFGIFTLMTAFITSAPQLALYRFLGGFGLGGAIPNALTFGSEYAPASRRANGTATMLAGMPGGSFLGAMAAVWLLPSYGWRPIFLLGGAVPIIIALLVALFLPESLQFLVRQGKDKIRIRHIVSKIAPALAADPDVEFFSNEKKLPGLPVKHLFMEGRAFTTILLWICAILSTYSLWVLITWAPTLMRQTGASVLQYSLGFAGIHLGSFVTFCIIGRIMDKTSPFLVLTTGFTLGAIALAVFGLTGGGSLIITATMAFICGAFINGSQAGILSLGTVFYPVAVRASGIGWVYGLAKVGAMLAPAIGGILLLQNWSASVFCGTQALVGLVLAALMPILGIATRAAARAEKTAAAGR